MGVSGSGKSAVGVALAQRLGMEWIDGDDLHGDAAVVKMRAGVALDDDDRWPWLDRIGARLVAAAKNGKGAVIACSALKRAYRDRIRSRGPGVRFVFLRGGRDLIAGRLAGRLGHYMPASLLHSQLDALEAPGPDEADVRAVEIDVPVASVVQRSVEALASMRCLSTIHGSGR